VLAEELHPAGGGADQAEDHPHRGGLARAVAAQEAVEVAFLDLEIQVLDGLEGSKGLGKPFRLEDGYHGGKSNRRPGSAPENEVLNLGAPDDPGALGPLDRRAPLGLRRIDAAVV